MTPRPCQQALDHVLDARAVNQAEHRALVNLDTPEIDSLIEAIVRLPMPDATRVALSRYADRVLALNTREAEHELQAAGQLDPLCARCRTVGFKKLADTLRPQLAANTGNDGAAYVRLVCTIRRYAEDPQVGPATLRSRTLRHELGHGPHDALCALLTEIERVHHTPAAA